ncbi:hypothetical protein GCM10010264_74130 [Streptomyces globisporus]|nr:hypothetical protein GCM10010264_74130 [Streptomyces globisporus]
MADFMGDGFEQLGGRDFDEELGQQVLVSFINVHLVLEVHGLCPVDELAGAGEPSGDPFRGSNGVATTERDSRCRLAVPGISNESSELTVPLHEVFKGPASVRVHVAHPA